MFRKEYFMLKRRVKASLMLVLFVVVYLSSIVVSFNLDNVRADDNNYFSIEDATKVFLLAGVASSDGGA